MRLHTFILSQHSATFLGMFTLPRDPNVNEIYDGVPVVKMMDRTEELELLVDALYNLRCVCSSLRARDAQTLPKHFLAVVQVVDLVYEQVGTNSDDYVPRAEVSDRLDLRGLLRLRAVGVALRHRRVVHIPSLCSKHGGSLQPGCWRDCWKNRSPKYRTHDPPRERVRDPMRPRGAVLIFLQ
jgi:hypothetical protein